MPWDEYTPTQLRGSEYGGSDEAKATVQPKGPDALTPGEILRLGYLTGDELNNPDSIEDHRQFWGLLPADKARPFWLEETGQESEAQVREVGVREL